MFYILKLEVDLDQPNVLESVLAEVNNIGSDVLKKNVLRVSSLREKVAYPFFLKQEARASCHQDFLF